MTHVVCEPCFGCKYTDCVVVCPVECFYEGEKILYIHPDECIDCEACVPECPVEAIFHEDNVPEEWKPFTAAERRNGAAVPGDHREERTAGREVAEVFVVRGSVVRCLRYPVLQLTTDDDNGPIRYFKSTDQYALSRNVFQLAYFGLPSLIVSSGLRFGRTGFLISLMPASCGVRPPLRTLQRTHAQTRFSQRRVAAAARGHDVVQAQFARGKPLAAVLAVVAVAGENVAAIQPHALLRHAIVVQQPQHPRHLDFKVHAANPVLVRLLELRLQLADFPPRFEVVIGPLVALDVDHLGQPAEQQHERPPHVDDVDRNVLTIEQQNAGTQSCTGSGRHTRVTPARAFSRVLGSHRY